MNRQYLASFPDLRRIKACLMRASRDVLRKRGQLLICTMGLRPSLWRLRVSRPTKKIEVYPMLLREAGNT